MLVLSRKLNQEIIIGDNVKVTVLKVKGNTVRLGIEAPREVRVVRGELPLHDKDEPKMAEVTIVFNDSKDKPVGDDSINLVPFKPKSNQPRITETGGNGNPSRAKSTEPKIQQLPASLSTNRLKDILAELSGQ